jgi:hypothetical protein
MPDHPAAEELLTPEEVATWLRVSPAWVRAHANGNRQPKLPSLKVGAFRRFSWFDESSDSAIATAPNGSTPVPSLLGAGEATADL